MSTEVIQDKTKTETMKKDEIRILFQQFLFLI